MANEAVPPWLLGANCTAMRVTRLSTTAAGLFSTYLTALDFLAPNDNPAGYQWGIIDGVEANLQAGMTENITSVRSPYENTVVLEQDDSFSVFEILRLPLGGNPNFLSEIWTTAMARFAPYAVVDFRRGGNAWIFYGLIGSYSKEVRKGKNVARMQFRQTDPQDFMDSSEKFNPSYEVGE